MSDLPDEAWGFEWGTADGNGGFVRLALHRSARVAWFWAYLLRPDGHVGLAGTKLEAGTVEDYLTAQLGFRIAKSR